jgi:hypothetical protein
MRGLEPPTFCIDRSEKPDAPVEQERSQFGLNMTLSSWREDGTFSGGWRPNLGADETVNVPYDIVAPPRVTPRSATPLYRSGGGPPGGRPRCLTRDV